VKAPRSGCGEGNVEYRGAGVLHDKRSAVLLLEDCCWEHSRDYYCIWHFLTNK
jgi:hypothetical protein